VIPTKVNAMMPALAVMDSGILVLDRPAQSVTRDVPTVHGGGLPTPMRPLPTFSPLPPQQPSSIRILSANQTASPIASVVLVASLRVGRPLSAPPDCVCEGGVTLQAGRRSATVTHLTPGLLCLNVNRTIISKLFAVTAEDRRREQSHTLIEIDPGRCAGPRAGSR